MNPLIDAPSLAQRLESEASIVLLDVRWALGDPKGAQHYAEAHVPGAVFVDLDHELADPATAERGRHPLPSVDRFETATRRWGITPSSLVVIYDNTGSLAASRAWWLLRAAGHAETLVLDGGLAAWSQAGLPLESGSVTPAPGPGLKLDTQNPWAGMATISQEQAGAWTSGSGKVLLDARAGERYRGEVEPVDPRPGHIPGALSAPTAGNLAADGRFGAAAALRERFEGLGVDPGTEVGAYCGSGVTAAHTVLALEIAGISAALYPGSYSQWSSNRMNEVATGDQPA
ncbi:sulfurtransferase [Pseudarthrobacter sp. J1738]|uniref:sulfurtransferase n=1 Tax=Pseudarthrobacter sp. J1738 TaxID=3420446 RepID=UPI003D2A7AC7